MIFKILHVILLASVKYFFTLPYAMIIGLNYQQALISVLIGGIGGFLFFYYLSSSMIKLLDYLKPKICLFIPSFLKLKFHVFCQRMSIKKPVRIFSRKSRFLVKVKTTYGFWGIIIATPFLLTIPVGAFLANRYYAKRPQTVPFMIISIISWAGFLSGIVHIFPRIFF
jgi:ABC-type antimicrobial peptide transport system permease subunit